VAARGTKARPEETLRDGGRGLLEELRHERGGEPDGAEEVGGNDGLGVDGGGRLNILGAHDPGVVDEDVQRGEVLCELGDCATNAGGVFDVEGDGFNAGVGGCDSVEGGTPATGNDDLIATLVELFGEGTADARAAARDEDCVFQ